jgi:hypothetical protein
MKSPTYLWRELSIELGSWCGVSTIRDSKRVADRVESEGLSFLTITLPAFGKDFEKSLDQLQVAPNAFAGFSRRQGLPLFLGGFLELIFNRVDGVLLDEPSIDAIFAVRQLCCLFSKVELPVSDRRKAQAMRQYVQCELDVQLADERISNDLLISFQRMSTTLWARAASVVDENVFYGRLVPKHGPGSTADRLLGNQKYRMHTWTQRLEECFPSGEYLLANWRHHSLLDHVELQDPGAEQPVKVISVPKTMKTPRIIAMEPAHMQYMQQAIMESLVTELERRRLNDLSPNWISQMIGFEHQEPNRLMARKASSDGSLATLDLSEASDRVSFLHVKNLLHRFPHLAEAVDATRSRTADVDGHGVIPLAKYASMGSGLCFPIEAMVFLTIVFVAIERDLNRQIRWSDLRHFCGKVRVYGDDIIVPVEYTHTVIETLEAFGLKVNSNKSFWTGKFRELCGGDYYDGTDVTPVKFRRKFPASRRNAQEIISLIASRNQFYELGLWQFARFLDTEIRKLIPFPIVEEDSPIHGRRSYLPYQGTRNCPELHRPLVKGVVTRSALPINSIDGHPALLKNFLKRGDLPIADRKHLERSGRPDSVNIKVRWATPY